MYSVNGARKHCDGANLTHGVFHARMPVPAAAKRQLLLGFGKFALKLLALFQKRGDPVRRFGRLNAKYLGNLAERSVLGREVIAGRRRGQRFNAPYAGGRPRLPAQP